MSYPNDTTASDQDAEQAAFEDWLQSSSPSGDVEDVQRQWEQSWEFLELFNPCPVKITIPESEP